MKHNGRAILEVDRRSYEKHATTRRDESRVLQVQIPEELRAAALDTRPVSGLTHLMYRYPCRFSPAFARSAIQTYSKPGDVVLDPFMGGGTTLVEGLSLGRSVIGADVNQLAVFVTRAKVARPSSEDILFLRHWADFIVTRLRYTDRLTTANHPVRPTNMDGPEFQYLFKLIALALQSAEANLTSETSLLLARCAILSTSQQLLHGSQRLRSAQVFRERLVKVSHETIEAVEKTLKAFSVTADCVIYACDAEELGCVTTCPVPPVDLIVTSPPYPGVHALYHRWQINGRRESNAPYWIAGCEDGSGASFYTFADRKAGAEAQYFLKAAKIFSNVRRLLRAGGIVVQLMSFASPNTQLPKYLRMMERAGFCELRAKGTRRLWRQVPGRTWHAQIHGKLASSREVLLVHEAL